MVELFYAEDDAHIAGVVKKYLEQKNFKVVVYNTISEVRRALEIHVPTVILLDWNMPDGRGDSLCQWIRGRWKELPIIFLTVRDDSHDIVSGFQNGADDYVVKPFGTMELISRVRAVLRRFRKMNEDRIYTIGELYVEPAKHIISVSGKAVSLSYKEYTLLLVLLEADGNVVERDRLLTSVWGEYYTESRTLDVHIRKLRVKLGDAGKMIQTVKGIGYKLGGVLNE